MILLLFVHTLKPSEGGDSMQAFKKLKKIFHYCREFIPFVFLLAVPLAIVLNLRPDISLDAVAQSLIGILICGFFLVLVPLAFVVLKLNRLHEHIIDIEEEISALTILLLQSKPPPDVSEDNENI